MAAQNGIELEQVHWEVITFLRGYFSGTRLRRQAARSAGKSANARVSTRAIRVTSTSGFRSGQPRSPAATPCYPNPSAASKPLTESTSRPQR